MKQEELGKAMAFLKLCPLTQGLATRTLHMLNVELERCEHAADTCFYLQGQAASGLFIIQEGTVTVYRNKRPDEMIKPSGDLTPRPEQGAVLGSKPSAAAPAASDVKPAEPTSEKVGSDTLLLSELAFLLFEVLPIEGLPHREPSLTTLCACARGGWTCPTRHKSW